MQLQLTTLDKIFWIRVTLGVVVGASSQLLFSSDYSSGVLLATVVFLGSYYLVRYLWGKQFKKEEQVKLYTTGLGSYVMLLIFFWILLFTLGVSYLALAAAPAL
jgi:hypothetical protein